MLQRSEDAESFFEGRVKRDTWEKNKAAAGLALLLGNPADSLLKG